MNKKVDIRYSARNTIKKTPGRGVGGPVKHGAYLARIPKELKKKLNIKLEEFHPEPRAL